MSTLFPSCGTALTTQDKRHQQSGSTEEIAQPCCTAHTFTMTRAKGAIVQASERSPCACKQAGQLQCSLFMHENAARSSGGMG